MKIKAILFDLGDALASPWILEKSLYEILHARENWKSSLKRPCL